MAFKSVKSYNDDKFGGFFLLRNDGDYADVIFMYESADDVLVADVHYIKSPDYSGYVHCCGKGCPACGKGIRTQTKLFIPLYNIQANEIQFFDRTMRFEPQLQQDVFAKYPNPSEYVFRITRHGEAGSVDTTYEIQAIGKNTFKPYKQILAEQNTSMPEHYSIICKEYSTFELNDMLSSSNKPNNGYSPNDEYQYNPVPRNGVAATIPEQPPIQTPTYSEPPEYIPGAGITSDDDDDLGDPEF